MTCNLMSNQKNWRLLCVGRTLNCNMPNAIRLRKKMFTHINRLANSSKYTCQVRHVNARAAPINMGAAAEQPEINPKSKPQNISGAQSSKKVTHYHE